MRRISILDTDDIEKKTKEAHEKGDYREIKVPYVFCPHCRRKFRLVDYPKRRRDK